MILLLQILLNDENEYDDEIFLHKHNVRYKIGHDIIFMEFLHEIWRLIKEMHTTHSWFE